MKAARFDLARPASLKEALRLLAEADGAAKAIAGGQSLGPMLNLRLAQPQLLIDLTAIPELTRIEESDGAVTFGACVSTAAIEDRMFPARGLEMLPEIATGIAYRAVRNRGTLGGSLCHADPAGDWMTALTALGAECLIAGAEGNRVVPLDAFMVSAFETVLAEGELLEAIRVPRTTAGSHWAYRKICRKAGEFAMAIGAVLRDADRGVHRAVAGATAGRPILLDGADILGDGQADVDATRSRADGVLAERGVADRRQRQWHAAALARALVEATAR